MNIMREVANLQESYRILIDENRLTKKSMCNLCIPFRNKYHLTDKQTLMIARNEMTLAEVCDLLEDNHEAG